MRTTPPLDAAANSEFVLADPKLAERRKHTFFPKADGATNLAVKVGGQTVTVPFKVTSSTKAPPTSFTLDVMPIFMREGCNVGACHGSARGQDGFMLSLWL